MELEGVVEFYRELSDIVVELVAVVVVAEEVGVLSNGLEVIAELLSSYCIKFETVELAEILVPEPVNEALEGYTTRNLCARHCVEVGETIPLG